MTDRLGIRGRAILVALVAVTLLGCAGAVTPSPSPTPRGEPLSTAQLRYRLIDEFGQVWYCDPDEYPVPRDGGDQLALERFPEIQRDTETFKAIVDSLDLEVSGTFDPGEQVAVYREWKQLNAIVLEPIGDNRYRFDLIALPRAGQENGLRTAGIIDGSGSITIEAQESSKGPNCPICLARGTLISTPRGSVRVEDLRLGDPVWTVDGSGRRIRGVVRAVGSATVAANHRVVHLVLRDGRVLRASPGHPLADGRLLRDLRAGDLVDRSVVVTADLVAYGHATTFDLLAAGPSGAYWADGILLGSTITR